MNHTINICLIPAPEFYNTCVRLNSLDSGKYNNNSRAYIPHVTLGMKTLNDQQIQKLSIDLKSLNFQKQRTNTLGYYAREVAPWDIWTWIWIEKTDSLQESQKSVLEQSEKYETQKRTPDTYAIDEFYEEEEISFFPESEYLARESLHITLGKLDIQNEYNTLEIPAKVTFDTLVIGKIWNYGSVREILFEINLT